MFHNPKTEKLKCLTTIWFEFITLRPRKLTSIQRVIHRPTIGGNKLYIYIYIYNIKEQELRKIQHNEKQHHNFNTLANCKLVKLNSPANCLAKIGEGMKSADAKRRQIIISRLAFILGSTDS